MTTRMRCSILAFAGLVASVLLSGCGGSSSTTIPATTTVFYAHTAVLSNFSTVLTTGYNAFGQLGNGNKDTQASLVPVLGLRRVNGVAVGADHTVAFANHSSVYAWGSNYHGQIGSTRDISGVNAYSSTPVRVQFYQGVVQAIAAGEFHNLVVAGPSNALFAWGGNGYGQLGDGSFADRTIPVPVQLEGGAGPLFGIAKVAAGGLHSLALSTDGRVYSWGYNVYGQLGRDPNTPLQSFVNTASLVYSGGAPLTNIAAIAAGGGTSYALENYVDGNGNSNQRLWGWGYNGGNQLGPITDPSKPYSVVPVEIPKPSAVVYSGTTPVTITEIAAGINHLVMRLSDGSVWAIGANRFAQLGNNDKNIPVEPNPSSSVPVQVIGPDGTSPLAGAIAIMASGSQSFALAPTQSNLSSPPVWYGWGDNGYGQLGNPISTSSIGYLLLPAVVRGF